MIGLPLAMARLARPAPSYAWLHQAARAAFHALRALQRCPYASPGCRDGNCWRCCHGPH